MPSLHVTGTRLGMRLGSLYISVVCTSRLVHFAYIGAYGSLCLVSLIAIGVRRSGLHLWFMLPTRWCIRFTSPREFDLPLVLGGHDFTDENAHTDSDGSLLPKGTPALVALDIAHI